MKIKGRRFTKSNILSDTSRVFIAYYKGHEVHVWRDDDMDQYYMQVRPIDCGYVVDGRLKDNHGYPPETIEEAVELALRGAHI